MKSFLRNSSLVCFSFIFVCFLSTFFVCFSPCTALIVNIAQPPPSGPISTTGPHNHRVICHTPGGNPTNCCCQTTYECAGQNAAISELNFEVISYDYQYLLSLANCVDVNINGTRANTTLIGDYSVVNIPVIKRCELCYPSDLYVMLDRFVGCQNSLGNGVAITANYATNSTLATQIFNQCKITVRAMGQNYNICATLSNSNCATDDQVNSPPTLAAYFANGGVRECPSSLPPAPTRRILLAP